VFKDGDGCLFDQDALIYRFKDPRNQWGFTRWLVYSNDPKQQLNIFSTLLSSPYGRITAENAGRGG